MANYIPKKNCRFCADQIEVIDYKDVKMLQKYITGYGKIESRKMSGTCPRHQRKLANALKRSRMMAMLPFTTR
ncbi:30S ribosomal protein S18 [bacterium CG2_30_37_16]|nr:MAG: 30S ribosomal protein S18 [bacterium CG2_30_37_16]PIP31105.1 MAG: 30S ribosomal protein S18 [bacterium (Candidatus Howlettbacteria) CG23_combo_of_CG06-09_8_20_14_all_37_9]PIX98742.1 MAG: 30S ribosomal protein S18 [bacterium (Candidatus Howlettbacteria) CG_4_10_14_3_um_filter_37_10]PJB06188.1 MAG: 30S ribosomal protein S18 [bacterium (Candidatus Howlettbacteria) CG_4_9_14_3_um_filter_37_10]